MTGVHTFSKVIPLKMNVIGKPEFNFFYYDITIQHFWLSRKNIYLWNAQNSM